MNQNICYSSILGKRVGVVIKKGCPFTKPDVIFKLEQEEEPWVMEEEVLKKHCPGEIWGMDEQLKIQDRLLTQLEDKFTKTLTDEKVSECHKKFANAFPLNSDFFPSSHSVYEYDLFGKCLEHNNLNYYERIFIGKEDCEYKEPMKSFGNSLSHLVECKWPQIGEICKKYKREDTPLDIIYLKLVSLFLHNVLKEYISGNKLKIGGRRYGNFVYYSAIEITGEKMTY
ncbi:hypothetical protein E5288_WYG020201 [Bos mutus]|uniref:KRAB domain-containing protein n=1 Tax=Bos mutus TaxID=72004 RepID=A0A6B0S0X6_9CETA|nr:hypothetical protein [Bos mutus]